MSRIAKVIKSKRGYFIQREDAKLHWDWRVKQLVFDTEHVTQKALAEELRTQFDEGYPINASDTVLKEIQKLIDREDIKQIKAMRKNLKSAIANIPDEIIFGRKLKNK